MSETLWLGQGEARVLQEMQLSHDALVHHRRLPITADLLQAFADLSAVGAPEASAPHLSIPTLETAVRLHPSLLTATDVLVSPAPPRQGLSAAIVDEDTAELFSPDGPTCFGDALVLLLSVACERKKIERALAGAENPSLERLARLGGVAGDALAEALGPLVAEDPVTQLRRMADRRPLTLHRSTPPTLLPVAARPAPETLSFEDRPVYWASGATHRLYDFLSPFVHALGGERLAALGQAEGPDARYLGVDALYLESAGIDDERQAVELKQGFTPFDGGMLVDPCALHVDAVDERARSAVAALQDRNALVVLSQTVDAAACAALVARAGTQLRGVAALGHAILPSGDVILADAAVSTLPDSALVFDNGLSPPDSYAQPALSLPSLGLLPQHLLHARVVCDDVTYPTLRPVVDAMVEGRVRRDVNLCAALFAATDFVAPSRVAEATLEMWATLNT